MGLYIKRRNFKSIIQSSEEEWPDTSYTKINRKPTLRQINYNRKDKTDCCCVNPDYCEQYSWASGNGFMTFECTRCGFLKEYKEPSGKF